MAYSFLAYAADLSNWNEYNGYSKVHSFSVKFPTDWKVQIENDELQEFMPKNTATPLFLIKEFEGQTYEQAANYYVDNDTIIVEKRDILIKSSTEDLLGEEVTFKKLSSGELVTKTFIKRGSLIVALSKETNSYKDILDGIRDSFKFSNNWHQYIDLKGKYTFIFPSTYSLNNMAQGVEILSNEDVVAVVENTEGPFHLTTFVDNVYSVEMFESFEFFDLGREFEEYEYFIDVTSEHANEEAINNLVGDGIISGYPDGTFRPDYEINRAELAKMIVASVATPDPGIYNNCFPDVAAQWFAPYICYAKEGNWVEGYDDNFFRPEQNVNRVEALKIILEVLFEGKIANNKKLKNKSIMDVNTNEWYAKYFIFADNNNLLDKQHVIENENSYFYLPNENISRKEIAETIYRSKKLQSLLYYFPLVELL